MSAFLKALAATAAKFLARKLRDWKPGKKRAETGEKAQGGRGVTTGAVIAVLALSCALTGCAVKDAYDRLFDAMAGGSSTEATSSAVEESSSSTSPTDEYSTVREKAAAIVKLSERCGRLEIPGGTAPSIKIGGYDLAGGMSWESSLGSGSISNTAEEREYMILTLSASGKVRDSASSHGYKDSRWNKARENGEELVAFCVVQLRDNRGAIEEWSEVTVVNAEAFATFLATAGLAS